MNPAEMEAPVEPEVLREVLAELGMSRRGLRRWFGGVRRFCERRGGERRYARMLQLLDACLAELAASDAGAAARSDERAGGRR
jgi:hypothetical protein